MKIILDTNILFLPVRDRIDIIGQINNGFSGGKEIIVLKDSIDELEKLDRKGVKDALRARENILKQKIQILSTEEGGDVDTKILKIAKKQNAFIATNDKLLRKRAKAEGISTLAFNKSKKRLVVV